MRLVDTHCHLDFENYKDDLEDVLERASSAGVVRMIVPGTSVASSRKAIELAGKYKDVFAAVGIHPHEADKTKDSDISRLRDIALESEKIVAIGEMGLDYYKGYSKPENQLKLFRDCLAIAGDLDLPVILHNRDAGEDLLSVLEQAAPSVTSGVVHCFSADRAFLDAVLKRGMHVSFTGNITFEKASNLREIAKHVPLENLLLETDSPYISPVPLRGKRNEPANVRYLLDIFAEIYDHTPEDIARITTHNANQLFRLGIEEKSRIAYAIRDVLYLNITNRCTNRCTFCTRNASNFVKGHNLRLEREPTFEEIIAAMGDISKYREITFCGYGEPTLRLGIIKKVASYVKSKGIGVRLVTNGEGDLIDNSSIAEELKGIVDRVSVSLNASDPPGYNNLCRSVFGEDAYGAILDFIRDCRRSGIEVEVTCLDLVGVARISECRRKAEELGAEFRLRHFNVVG